MDIRHRHFIGISLRTLLGSIMRGFIWDIPILSPKFGLYAFFGP